MLNFPCCIQRGFLQVQKAIWWFIYTSFSVFALLPYSRGRSTHYSDWFYDFSLTILDAIRMSTATVSFVAQADTEILPTACFPFTYDVNHFKYRTNRRLFTLSMNYLGQLALEALENTQLKSNFENSEIEILS